MKTRMKATRRALAVASALAACGIVACGGSVPDEGAGSDGALGQGDQPLRGGDVITGATGVVDFSSSAGSCTGSMIAPNVVLSAAHCFDNAGAKTVHDGNLKVTINYYDPALGRRQVYSGLADWHVYPTYDGAETPSGAGGANDDMSVIVIPGTFEGTNYHDYLRIYDDIDGPLDANLTAYGAGVFTYSGKSDDNLRTSWFEVESVDINHLVVDTRDLVSHCVGDSGGPLVKFAKHAGVSFPLVAGVLSKGNTDPGTEGDLCTNNDPPNDNSYYCRANATRINWIETKIGHSCVRPNPRSADLVYRRCFDPPFIEDVPGEGLEPPMETAIVMSIL
jgi:hypothetical protein